LVIPLCPPSFPSWPPPPPFPPPPPPLPQPWRAFSRSSFVVVDVVLFFVLFFSLCWEIKGAEHELEFVMSEAKNLNLQLSTIRQQEYGLLIKWQAQGVIKKRMTSFAVERI